MNQPRTFSVTIDVTIQEGLPPAAQVRGCELVGSSRDIGQAMGIFCRAVSRLMVNVGNQIRSSDGMEEYMAFALGLGDATNAAIGDETTRSVLRDVPDPKDLNERGGA